MAVKKEKARKKLTYEQVFNFINNLGYKLLSTEYTNSRNELNIQCPKGHEYFIKFKYFKYSGNRCAKCSVTRTYTHEEIRANIESYGYKYLDDVYINSKQLLNIMCPSGHVYKTKWDNFYLGKRCKKCSGLERYTYDFVSKVYEKEDYTLLTKEYRNGKTKNIVKCPNNHIVTSTFVGFYRSGKRCSKCNISKTEILVRKIFERIVNKPFPSTRPIWLINPETGRKLELDGYCEELQLAFEYDGEWHYQNNARPGLLNSQQNRDKVKNRLCKENGVSLIRIPYFIENKEEFIKKELIRLNIRISE